MFADLTSLVPRWVLWGIGLGAVATALVALAFYLGDRFAPAPAASLAGTVWRWGRVIITAARRHL